MNIAPTEIPQSAALAEASPDSIAELFNKDPEKLSSIELSRLVDGLRAQRIKWKAAEANAPARAPKAASKAKSLISQVKADELDL